MKLLTSILDRLMQTPEEARTGALVRSATTTSPDRSSPTGTGSTVYLLLDVSQSMDEAKLRQATDGGISFAENAVSKGYRVGVIQFTTWARLRVEPTTNRRAIEKGLSQVGLQATTNMAAAIELATSLFGSRKGQRAVVLVTDGYPDSAGAALAAADQAKKLGITIIAIGTDDADRNFLKKLASASKLATTVPDAELKMAITNAARLLPARTASSK